MPSSYVQRQQQTEQAKVKEVEGMRKDIDALVQLVQGLRTNLERIPSKIEQLVAGFASSIKTLSNNYDLRDSGKTTTGIVNNVLKSSRSMEAELSSSARAVFQDHTFTFLKNWIDTLLKLQIRFDKLEKNRQAFDHYTKKVAHLVSEREKRKQRGKGEDAVHIEKMARNEEKLRTAAGTFHTERQQLVTMVKAALAAKTPYLNQVYHNYSQSLRLVFNSGKHETEPFENAIAKFTQHMKETRRDMLVATMHAEELMDPKSPFRQTQRDIDAARGRVQGSSPKAEESTGFADDDEMETDDFWSPGGAANSGWDVKLQGDESEDDSYGDSDDDNWSNTVSSPSHSKPASSNSFRAAPAPASDPFGDDLGGMLGFNTAPAPASAPISIPAPKSSSSDTTENRDFFGFSYKTPIPAPAAAPGGGPDLYARPMPRVPAEESRPVRRKGPYLWDYTYKLWRHQSNGTFYNEQTKLYTRNPRGGQWLRLVNGQLVP
mmetsp:Transcript_9146/g.13270  ORF Transcript_9146/g.13270 Transcript_9146/m.13270 type:complete len:489 (-) Transcript_9146:40-1506(-)